MWLFKTKKGIPARAVIHDDCYSRLPDTLKTRFAKAPDDSEVTHVVDQQTDVNDDEEFTLVAAAEGALDLILGSGDTPTENYIIDPPTPDPVADPEPEKEFGGGESDGGGAGDSY
jgi:hypothetical protein